MYTHLFHASKKGQSSRPRQPPALPIQYRSSTIETTGSIDRNAYAMKLPQPEEDPFDYDWGTLQEAVDEPIVPISIGLFNDITLESLAEEPADPDWWGVPDAPADLPSDDTSHGQGVTQEAELQPDRQDYIFPMCPPSDPQDDDDLICRFPGCRRGSKPFKHKGDLTRHSKSHDRRRKLLCTAQECRLAFTRNDKFRDHIRAGHDDETLFSCPANGCQASLTKDFLPLHNVQGRFHDLFSGMSSFRQCPMPKCPTRFRLQNGRQAYNPEAHDALQSHLLEGHDIKGRERFASLLADKGYHYESADVLCPVCPDIHLFSTHDEFVDHLVDSHLGAFRRRAGNELRMRAPGSFWLLDPENPDGYRAYETIPRELREHRRTVLSLWPEFSSHPVWDDVKRCSGSFW